MPISGNYIYIYFENKTESIPTANDITIYDNNNNIVNYDKITGNNIYFKNKLLNDNRLSNVYSYIYINLNSKIVINKIIIDTNEIDEYKIEHPSNNLNSMTNVFKEGYLEVLDSNKKVVYIYELKNNNNDNYFVINPNNINLGVNHTSEEEHIIEHYRNDKYNDIYIDEESELNNFKKYHDFSNIYNLKKNLYSLHRNNVDIINSINDTENDLTTKYKLLNNVQSLNFYNLKIIFTYVSITIIIFLIIIVLLIYYRNTMNSKK